ncbi:endospore germination permease [Tissierella sp.]|uniref:GerAB/ArcD/ProY family transporter n=1 Tax=Tissierella sp. TaxID=41274 RepID=UPI00305C82C6
MRESNKISTKQIRALVVSTIVGVGILSLPNEVAVLLGKDGWIAIIIGGLLMAAGIIIINKLFDLYPDKDFFEIGEEVLGKWIFNIFLIFVFSYLVGLMSSVARNLAEILKAFLLETTPTEIMIVTFVLTTSYIARSEIQIIGRAAYLIYPVILGFIIFLIFVSLPNSDFTNILPVFQSSMKGLPKSIEVSFFSYLGFEILLFSIPFTEERKKTLKASLTGIGIVMAMYVIIFILCLSQYGIHHLQRQTFPTLSIIKEIDLPGYFIENLDGLVMAIWVLIVFATMASTYYSAGKVLSKLFITRDHSLFIIPLLPIVYIVSLIPQNIIEVNKQLGTFINYSGLVSIFILPILIYCIGYIKLRWKRR